MLLDQSLSAAPDTSTATAAEPAVHYQTAGWGGEPGRCGVGCACGLTYDGFDTIAEAAAFLNHHIQREAANLPATAAQMWARLGTAIDATNLPAPSMITVNPNVWAAHVWLQNHNAADLLTWAAWLGAGPATVHVYDSPSEPGRVMRRTLVEANRWGWAFTVTLLEALPIEQAAVAFGGAR